MKLDKMKPTWTANKSVEESIVFSRIEQQIEHHPIIILYSDRDEQYYYIKARSANIGESVREKFQGEIFVPKNVSNLTGALFRKDSLIDTTQIYVIDERTLEEMVDKKNISYLNTSILDKNIASGIYLSIVKNIEVEIPPFVSLSYVYKNENGSLEANTLYSNEELLERDIQQELKFGTLSFEELKDFKKDVIEIRNQTNNNEIKLVSLLARSEYKYYIHDKKMDLNDNNEYENLEKNQESRGGRNR